MKDRAKLDEVVTAHVTGSDFTQEDYKGQAIWSGNVGDTDKRVSYVMTDDAFVVGTRSEDVKAALDAKSGEIAGLADNCLHGTAQLNAR